MNPTIKTYLSRIGRKGGKVRSEAKTAAVRENAKKGGWPKGRKRWWYTAEVRNSSGVHRVFYSTTKPVIGSTCPGVAEPNKIIGFKREPCPCS